MKQKTRKDPYFLSEKQFGIIARNSRQESDGTYTYQWEGFLVVCEECFSKKNTKYYIVKFTDETNVYFKKSGSFILNHLLTLRDECKDSRYPEYAKAYYDAIMSLLKITELDMESDSEQAFESHCIEILERSKELNKYYVDLLQAIKKFMVE